jgi:hypothetical protein
MSIDLHQLTAGLPPGTEIAERAPQVEGDRDAIFKKSLHTAHETPHGLSKTAGVERESFDPKSVTTRAEGEGLVTDMIRRKHATASGWNPFLAVQDPAIDKLLGQVGPGERGEIAIENGAKVVRVSKAHAS